jgi:hypothetical protein
MKVKRKRGVHQSMKKSKVTSNGLRLSRRQSVLATSSAALLAMVLPRRSLSEPVSQPRGADAAHYIATLTLGSVTYTFDSKTAVDQGNYLGSFVQQKSLMATLPNCPFTVFFRPDLNGKRDEVVVELGKMWSFPPTHMMTPYTLRVTKDGHLLFTQSVPYHWWWSRWRWQSSARPFIRDAASLTMAKNFLPYSKNWLYGYKAWATNLQYTPMGLAGMEPAQGTVGDRPELGPLTLPQSDYILLGTPLAKSSMIAQAEACATMPFHIRDEQTGRWLDNRAYPYYSLNKNAGPPIVPDPGPPRLADGTVDRRYFLLEGSHMPSLSYAPYLFTDDPYYLEELQAMALYHIVESSYHPVIQALPGLVNPSETRTTAWGNRTVAQTALVTPENLPSWLQPKSLWLANLADNRTFLQRYMDSPSLVQKVFRAYSRSEFFQGFMIDYTMISLAWIVRMGFTQWLDGYQWAMGAVMPLVSDASGWLKGWPNPYWYFPFIKDVGPHLYYPDTSQDANTYPTWAALFQRYVSDKGQTNDPTLQSYPPAWDGVSIRQTQSSAAYFLWRQGVLHLAVGLKVPGAQPASTWLDSQIPVQLGKYGGTNDPRWSFDVR